MPNLKDLKGGYKVVSSPTQSEPGMSQGKAAQTGFESGVLFGGRPVVAGIGGAAGKALAEYQFARQKDASLLDALKQAAGAIPSGYEEGRQEAVSEQEQAYNQYPETAVISGIGGGLLTAPITPIKSLAGAVKLGAGTGALTALGENEGLVGGATKGALIGAVPYGIGKAFSGAGRAIEGATNEFAQEGGEILKQNADEILAAGNRLGVTPTKGMLSGGKVIPGLESSLEQSPTPFGWMVRRQTGPVREALKEGAESAVQSRSGLGAYEAGDEVKRGLLSRFGEKLDPLSAQFEGLSQEASKVALNPKSKEKIISTISKLEDIRTGGAKAQGLVTDIANRLQGAKNVQELNNVISVIGKQAGASQDPLERQMLGKVYDRLRSFSNRSIVEAGKEIGGEPLAKQFVKEAKQARKGYRELGKDVEAASDVFGFKKGKTIPQSFERLDDVRSEGIIKKAFNINDQATIQKLKDQFPDQFDVLRKTKLQELYDQSLVKGNFSPERFMNNIKKIPEGSRSALFGKDKSKLDDIKKILDARPDRMGPSGTPEGMAFLNMFSPSQNLQDALRYFYYSQGGMNQGLQRAVTKGAKGLQKSDKAAKGLIKGMLGAYPAMTDQE